MKKPGRAFWLIGLFFFVGALSFSHQPWPDSVGGSAVIALSIVAMTVVLWVVA